MDRKLRYTLSTLATVSVLLTLSCRPRGAEALPAEPTATQMPAALKRFTPTLPPTQLSEEQKLRYALDHYWDNFDFSDTTFIATTDFQQILTAYAIYVGGYLPDSLAHPVMSQLMQKASTSKPMFEYFLKLADIVLHHQDSHMRNDEKYIPVLEAAMASPLLDEYAKMRHAFDLEMALKNRVGRMAQDFSYTLPSGATRRLYSVNADYILVFFGDPDCPMCRGIREKIVASPTLTELLAQGRLKIIAVYPDEDLAMWRNHLADYPDTWINSYDKDMALTKNRTYDLRAIPSLYLLDSQKRVVLKDCTNVERIEQALAMAKAASPDA